jgi:hypothetical protein
MWVNPDTGLITWTGLQSQGVEQRKSGIEPGNIDDHQSEPEQRSLSMIGTSGRFRFNFAGAARRSVSVATADGLAKHAGFGLCALHK